MSTRSDTRERLIDAAIEVITTRGEAALRLSEIAKTVGIKQPSIYHFFPGREELVVAACREHYQRAVMTALVPFERAMEQATTKQEWVDGAVSGLRFAYSDDRIEVREARLLLLSKALTNAELRRELNDATYEGNLRLASTIERAQLKGWIRDDVSPLTLAVWYRGQVWARLILEMDRQRYDGDEWTEWAIAAMVAATTTP